MTLKRLNDITVEAPSEGIDEHTVVVAELHHAEYSTVYHSLGYNHEDKQDAVMELRRHLLSDSMDVVEYDPSWARLLTSNARLEFDYDTFNDD